MKLKSPMRLPQKKCSPEDIARRAVFTRKLARRRSRTGSLRGPRFRLESYMHKLRGANVLHESPGPWDLWWSYLGCFLGIFILNGMDRFFFTGDQHLLLGSFGASSLIIFGAPHSVFAQPRSVLGGQIISSFVGVSVFLLLGGYPTLAAPLAVALALLLMQLSGTMHPPGGATALIAVSGHPVVREMGYLYTIFPVATGFAVLLLIGLIINNLSRHRQYPMKWW